MSKVMIYSNEHKGWWKPYYFGYTQCSKEAGIFDLEDAIKKYPKLDYDTSNEDFLVDVSIESIKEVDTSEALECLESIWCDISTNYINEYVAIKQALLKAQEPKQYLKWEDLEFEEEGQETLVLLNGTKYRMYYYKGYDECINLFTEDETSVIHIFEGCYSQDKQFFNDLHLEMVE